MNNETLLQIIKKLEGIDYAFISGFAMEILTNGVRKAKDVDIVVRPRDIDKLAGRFGCKPETRKVSKGYWKDVEDCSFRTTCGGNAEYYLGIMMRTFFLPFYSYENSKMH